MTKSLGCLRRGALAIRLALRTERIDEARREGLPERAFSSCLTGAVCASVVAHGLEVVRGCVIGDVRAQLHPLHVRCAEVEPRPDACLDDFVDRLREAGEGSP